MFSKQVSPIFPSFISNATVVEIFPERDLFTILYYFIFYLFLDITFISVLIYFIDT